MEKEKQTLGAFYDRSTGKIFLNENEKEEEIRPALARERKIREDLQDGKGKLNAEGKARVTVAGEIAYKEVLGRVRKKPADTVNINNLANASMNPDNEVTADLTDKETERQYFNSLKYAESEDGTRKIRIAKEKVEKLKTEDVSKEYYVRVDGIKKEVKIESFPKANPYTRH